jgi:hypothetical protein
MSVDAHTNATGTDMPGDAESLTDATPVLLQRQLVPGTDTSTLSRFGQNRWHVNEGIFEEDAAPYSFSLTAIPAPFRQLAKHYLWQVINHDAPSSMRRAAVERPSLRTIANMWTPLTLFLKWLHTRGITEMDHVTAELLDDYLIEGGAEDITLERSIDASPRSGDYGCTAPCSPNRCDFRRCHRGAATRPASCWATSKPAGRT